MEREKRCFTQAKAKYMQLTHTDSNRTMMVQEIPAEAIQSEAGKRLEEDKETLRLAIFEGGKLNSRWYIDLTEEPWENLTHRFYATPYFHIADEGYGHLQREKSFVTIEKLADDFLIDFLRVTRYTPFGVEPLIAYLVAKLNE